MNRLPATTGWLWLTQGFALFRRQPGLLTMLLLANLMFTMLMFSLQIVGAVVYALLTPSINMVMFEASRRIASGERLTPDVLTTGFRNGALKPLVKLGAVYLVVVIVIALVAVIAVPQTDQTAVAEALMAAKKSGKPIVLPESVRSFMVFLALIAFVVTLCLSFAPPLVNWKKMPTFKAIFYSVFAVFGSLGPVLVMLLSWGAIYMATMSIVGMVFGQSLGAVAMMCFHFVLMAVFQCTLFAAYSQLIPASPPPAE